MNTIRSLIYKDIRRFWPFFVVMAVLIFTFFAYYREPLRNDPHAPLLWFTMSMLMLLVWGAWGLLVAFIIHDDPPSGSSEFWMTRPISGTQLLVAKSVIVALFCVLLPVVMLAAAKVLGLAQNEWLHDSKNHMAIVSFFPILFVITLGLEVLASVTRNTLQYIGATCGVGIGYFFFTTRSALKTVNTGIIFVTQYKEVLEWTSMGIFIIGTIFIIYTQYKCRRRRLAIGLTVLLVLMLCGINTAWPTKQTVIPPSFRPSIK